MNLFACDIIASEASQVPVICTYVHTNGYRHVYILWYIQMLARIDFEKGLLLNARNTYIALYIKPAQSPKRTFFDILFLL